MSELLTIFGVFARITIVAFGGGIGILPEMERLTVGEHGWVTHQEFVDAFALSQVTPGPGMLMVVAIGYSAAGIPGAAVAGIAMFGPTALITWLVADRWGRIAQRPAMRLVRAALGPVALGLLAAGCYTLFRLGVHGVSSGAVAVAALLAVAVLGRSPAMVVGLGAVAGLAFMR